jgi:hypothetical protein
VINVDDVGRTLNNLASVQMGFIGLAIATPPGGPEAALLRDPDGHALLLCASHG